MEPERIEEKPSSLSPKAKYRIIFWLRMLGWIAFACVIPIVTFSVKFGLFEKQPVVTDSLGNVIQDASTKFNGWGIVSCLIIGCTVYAIVKEVIAACPGYSFTKQWLTGFVKNVLPLLIGFFICMFVQNMIGHIMFFLGTLAVCQFIAIPLNPLPEWRYRKIGAEDYSTALNYFTKLVKKDSKNESED